MTFKNLIILLFSLFNLCSIFGFQNNIKPNYIIIFVDDMGYGDIGVFGNPTISTPNLDKMAYEDKNGRNFILQLLFAHQVEQPCLLEGFLFVVEWQVQKTQYYFPIL